MSTPILISVLAEFMGVVAVGLLLWLNPRLRPVLPGFRYPRREAVISLTLFSLLLFVAIMAYSGGLPIPLAAPAGVEGLWNRLLLGMLALVLIVLALVVRKQPARSAGWISGSMSAAWRWGLALVFLTFFLRGAIFRVMDGVQPDEMAALVACLGISFSEETVFRGYIQLRLNSWAGERYGWLLTAVLSSLWQLPRLLLDPAGLLLNLVFVVVQSLILGWLMQRSGHILAVASYRTISEWIFWLT